ncbi:MAG TPA: NADP-dependent oxidoreductase [Propionibacteriaceae bacterium]|nr:NADP-dependent oxidoreductase [Propionibacteriaceae bacterium]
MRAVQCAVHGGPEVLEWSDAPEPHAVPGTVRIAVQAASVNAIDWKIRAGRLGEPASGFPILFGFDAAGIVDEVGEGAAGVQPGDAVFGLGSATHAELAVLKAFVPKPARTDWSQAAAAGTAGETSVRALSLLGVTQGSTVVVDGAAGGVGAVAVQVARARGAFVIATASEANHDYLSSLGAIPVRYGAGLADRVAHLAPDGVDAVFDVVGKSPLEELIGMVHDPRQVVSIANFSAPSLGARASGGGGDPAAALAEIAALLDDGQLRIDVQTYPMTAAADAHRLLEQGHVRGKLVLTI